MPDVDLSVPLLVAVIVGALLYGSRRRSSAGRARASRERSRAAFLEGLERALGIAILVRSVEPGPPARVTATLLTDTRTAEVVGVGDTLATAWDDLARRALHWRKLDEQSIRIYGGGG